MDHYRKQICITCQRTGKACFTSWKYPWTIIDGMSIIQKFKGNNKTFSLNSISNIMKKNRKAFTWLPPHTHTHTHTHTHPISFYCELEFDIVIHRHRKQIQSVWGEGGLCFNMYCWLHCHQKVGAITPLTKVWGSKCSYRKNYCRGWTWY